MRADQFFPVRLENLEKGKMDGVSPLSGGAVSTRNTGKAMNECRSTGRVSYTHTFLVRAVHSGMQPAARAYTASTHDTVRSVSGSETRTLRVRSPRERATLAPTRSPRGSPPRGLGTARTRSLGPRRSVPSQPRFGLEPKVNRHRHVVARFRPATRVSRRPDRHEPRTRGRSARKHVID